LLAPLHEPHLHSSILSPSALFPTFYPQKQHTNIWENDGMYNEDGWKGMLRMKLKEE
jgi:hypothetical protein